MPKSICAHRRYKNARDAAPAKAKFKRVRRPTDLTRRRDLCHVRPRDSHPVSCSTAFAHEHGIHVRGFNLWLYLILHQFRPGI
jgi:hypothetical protein